MQDLFSHSGYTLSCPLQTVHNKFSCTACFINKLLLTLGIIATQSIVNLAIHAGSCSV